MNRSTKQGAPDYHITSAHSRKATNRVPRYATDFTAGLMLGLLVGAVAFAVILWAWVIPTMDNAVAIARGMVA